MTRPALNASAQAWAEHALELGIEVPPGTKRTQIIELVDAAPAEPEPAEPEPAEPEPAEAPTPPSTDPDHCAACGERLPRLSRFRGWRVCPTCPPTAQDIAPPPAKVTREDHRRVWAPLDEDFDRRQEERIGALMEATAETRARWAEMVSESREWARP